jgi:hypothetical protein
MPLVIRNGKLLIRNDRLAFADDPCDCCQKDEPCGTSAAAGGPGTTAATYSMPKKAGVVTFSYESFGIPDRYVVEGGGQIFIDTGEISGGDTLTFCKPEGLRKVTVTVFGPASGTAWEYTIGCPEDDCTPRDGVGASLAYLLSRFWIRHIPGCKCSERAARLDAMGPEWARENKDVILGWMEEEANRRGLPYIRMAAELVLAAAISRAERALRG